MMTKMNLIKKSLLGEALIGVLILVGCLMSAFKVPDIILTTFTFACILMLLIPLGIKMLCINEENDEMCMEHERKAKSKTYDLLKDIFILMVIIAKDINPLIILAILLITKSMLFIHYEKCGE